MSDRQIEDGYWWVIAPPNSEEFVVKVDKSWVFLHGVSGWARTEDFVFVRKVK